MVYRNLCNQFSTLLVVLLLPFLLTFASGQSQLCNGSYCLAGNCSQNGSAEVCVCSRAYPSCTKEASSNCSTVTDFCLNNSTCLYDSTSGFTCQCPAAYTGERCDLEICEDAYCNNQGVCLSDNGTKSCQCNACYDTGPACATLYDSCTLNNKCDGNHTASCRNECINGLPDSFCSCKDGFVGDSCSRNNDECTNQERCMNNGTCIDTIGSFRCNCTVGWDGDDCSQNIDECTEGTNECDPEHTLQCQDLEGSYFCNCSLGYTGWNCSTPSCDVVELCSGHGTCSTNSTDWWCDCDEFYGGERCEIPGPCVSAPCVHGTCQQFNVDGSMIHNCTCDPGWTNSTTCNDNINECDIMSPCENGGDCIDTPGDYNCNCTQYWTGDTCKVDVKECDMSPAPCGEGTCTELTGNYSCDCTGTGYEGGHCEINTDDCVDVKCLNGGSCQDEIKGYICNCDSRWDGRHCDTRDWCSDQCIIANTLNGNSCINLVDKANCTCKPSHLGSNCSIMNPCDPNPCDNSGTCVTPLSNGGNVTAGDPDYTCSCGPGYTGTECQTALADPNLAVYISVPIVLVFALAIIIGGIVCFVMARKKRATRGRYSPSRNEILGPNLPMSGMLKPPPEERLI